MNMKRGKRDYFKLRVFVFIVICLFIFFAAIKGGKELSKNAGYTISDIYADNLETSKEYVQGSEYSDGFGTDPKSGVVEGEYIVLFKKGVRKSEQLNLLSKVEYVAVKKDYAQKNVKSRRVGGGRGAEIYDRILLVDLGEGKYQEKALSDLWKDSKVDSVMPNYVVQLHAVPNDPYFNRQNNLREINITSGWDINTGGEVIVAVVDSGVNYTHPDLMNNIWINDGEDLNHNEIVDESDFNGEDDDGNGYIDDIRGWDFALNNNDPNDRSPDGFGFGHGTPVAGIIGAVGNNNLGIAGVNWRAKIMPLKFVYNDYSGRISDVIESYQYASNNGAKIISCSWGYFGDYTEVFRNIIDEMYAQDIFIVASMGNTKVFTPFVPAIFDKVMAVGGTDTNGEGLYSLSTYGEWIDISATTPAYTTLRTNSFVVNDIYANFGGTSASAPHVSGLASLLLSVNPMLKPKDLELIIKSSAKDNGALGKDLYFGEGLINIGNALLLARNNPILPEIEFSSIKDGDYFSRDLIITGTAEAEDFAEYRVEYAFRGDSAWTLATASNTAVDNGVLANLDINPAWNDGIMNIRLRVKLQNGDEFFITKTLNYVTTTIFSPGIYEEENSENVNIIGTAGGEGFLSYQLDYSLGIDSAEWINFVNSQISVDSGLLGTLNLLEGTDTYVNVKLTTNYGGGISKQYNRTFYVNGHIIEGFPVEIPNYSEFTFPVIGANGPITSSDYNTGNIIFVPISSFDRTFYKSQSLTSVNKIQMLAYNQSGQLIEGWPPVYPALSIYPSMPSIGDIDNDGENEIVFTSYTFTRDLDSSNYDYMTKHQLIVLRNDGSLVFFRDLQNEENNMPNPDKANIIPILDDIDGDGYLDIITKLYDKINAYDRFGNTINGFPIMPSGISLNGDIAVGDTNNDGLKEIVFVGKSTDGNYKLYYYNSGLFEEVALNLLSSSIIKLSPLIADFNGGEEKEIILTIQNSGEDTIKLYNRAGILAEYNPGININGLSLGDINNDGGNEIVFQGNITRVETLEFNKETNQFNSMWAYNLDERYLSRGGSAGIKMSNPLIADITNDGRSEIIVKMPVELHPIDPFVPTGTSECNGTPCLYSRIKITQIYAFHDDGIIVENFPKQLDLPSTVIELTGYVSNAPDYGSMHLTDLNNDGYLDLVAGSTNRVKYEYNGGKVIVKQNNGRIKAWSLDVPVSSNIQWGVHRGEKRNTGNIESECVNENVLTNYINDYYVGNKGIIELSNAIVVHLNGDC